VQPKPVQLKRVREDEDPATICVQIRPDLWGKDSDMGSYQPKSLKEFLRQNGILLLAYSVDKIAGVALGYTLPHPSPGDSSLYIHELDTHPDFRRQGVGMKLMEEAFRVGKELRLGEVWLATETENDAAYGLYKKLNPTEIEQSVTYSYKVK